MRSGPIEVPKSCANLCLNKGGARSENSQIGGGKKNEADGSTRLRIGGIASQCKGNDAV